MEQDLNSYNEIEIDSKHFKLLHINQSIKGNIQYQKWLDDAIIDINQKNEESYGPERFNIIHFCKNCCSYAIFLATGFSYIECQNCHYTFCYGCGREPIGVEISTCLIGFLKINYLRLFKESIKIIGDEPLFYVLHIIFSLFLTPLYIGFIFNMIGFLSHPNKKNEHMHMFTDNANKLLTIYIYSIIKGILFFPYIITFFPIFAIILLPGIFFKKYYMKIFTIYFTIVMAGGESVKNQYW